MLAKIGHSAPPFALRDQNDQNMTPLEDDVMGDPVILIFDRNPLNSGADDSAKLLRAFATLHHRLNATVATIFVISRRSKEENARLARSESFPFHLLTDESGEVFQAFGIVLANAPADPVSLVLDANGRVVEICQNLETPEQADRVLACVQELDAERPSGMLGIHPPVLVIPNAMDAELCERLIETWHGPVPLWDGDGKASEGFNVEQSDFKVRNALYGNVTQYVVRDRVLAQELDSKVMTRVVPQMEKAFGFRPTGREDYRIACYDAAEGGSLPAHRDSSTESTRHRRFTVSVNLNNGSFEGGELAFREASDHRYEVDEGTAIVWACTLLHEVLPVTAGRRFILGTHLFG